MNANRRKLVVANWKMNGSLAANEKLLTGFMAAVKTLGNIDMVVCVPYPYLFQAQKLLQGSNVTLGAQNTHQHNSGAYTGEVSSPMLAEFGCTHVVVGHSERRTHFGQTNAGAAALLVPAVAAGLTPVFCFGETLTEREAGITEQVITRQVEEMMDVAGMDLLLKVVLAYEPVWAIGTGRTATPELAQEVHALVRQLITRRNAEVASRLCILYGGSVNAKNAADLFAMPDIDGGIIGGASLELEQIAAICRAASGV